ncbi:MAG: hypothetical protein GY842_15355 [bacterium]|nr:hypothetical protein [bacterium]
MKAKRKKRTTVKPVDKLRDAAPERMSAELDREFVADTLGTPNREVVLRLK